MNHPICGDVLPSRSQVADCGTTRSSASWSAKRNSPHVDPILPLFVRPGKGVRQEISSMPGNYQLSTDTLVDEVKAVCDLGIKSFILFGIPEYKDAILVPAPGRRKWNRSAASGALRKRARLERTAGYGRMLREYTDHGHCGILKIAAASSTWTNDATLSNTRTTVRIRSRRGGCDRAKRDDGR